MRLIPAALALAALAAPALARDHIPDATPNGKPVSCVPLSQLRESRVRDDRTIDFITSRHQAYRNTLPYACSGLGFEQRFSYETSLSVLCSTDTITVLYSSPGLMRGPTCGLGQFQPVTLGK